MSVQLVPLQLQVNRESDSVGRLPLRHPHYQILVIAGETAHEHCFLIKIMYIHIYTYTHIHIYTYTHIHIYTYTHIHIYTCTHIHIYTCTHIHIYTYTHIHIYTYTHIHIYTYTPKVRLHRRPHPPVPRRG